MDRVGMLRRHFRATMFAVLAATILAALPGVHAVAQHDVTGQWVADLGNGRYRNPVLAGDWSDPDVVRVGSDYYLTASSFSNVPGLPILHSRDLVNWQIIGHALPRLLPEELHATPRRGGGVWAPAIRHHNGLFLIYYADPDLGVFVVSARDPKGPWSAPQLVDSTRGAIDPAPFWDEDGSGWLVHAFAKSRAGINNVIVLKRLSDDGLSTRGPAVTIIDGDRLPKVATSIGPRPWQTTEGPKLYKRNGWYYLFAPSGSVKGGWQGVFRSRSIAGPYVGRNVLDQGPTETNGPHQGAWVTTASGEDWFLHFQDRDSYGRVVHLQPMVWRKDWPVIGTDPDGNGIGEPVATFRKPDAPAGPASAPIADDTFDQAPSLAWQFGSNPLPNWASVRDGALQLRSVAGSPDLFETGAVLSQKLPGFAFTATTLMRFRPLRNGERAGLALHGGASSWIGLERRDGVTHVVRHTKADPAPGSDIRVTTGPDAGDRPVWLRLSVRPVTKTVGPPDFSPYWPSMLRETHALATFSYSFDGQSFEPIGDPFESRPGRWIGAQIGLFAQAPYGSPAATAPTVGHAEFDWFRITQ